MAFLQLLACDLGAAGGRVCLSAFDGRRLSQQVLHSFTHQPHASKEASNLLFWDLGCLLQGIHDGIDQASALGVQPACLGIDTWGVDYGLLDAEGKLIGGIRSYRMAKDEEMAAFLQKMPASRLYAHTGLALQNYNTVFQLQRRRMDGDPSLDQAERLLFLPDLLSHLLGAEAASERTIASTSGLVDIERADWSQEVAARIGIKQGLLQPLVSAGSLRGKLSGKTAGTRGLPLAAVGGHDTASAIAALALGQDSAFCSLGTWCLLGFLSDTPCLSHAAFGAGISNEGSVQGGFRVQKNLMGLWLIQEVRKAFAQGTALPRWELVVAQAREALPFQSLVDINSPDFFQQGNLPGIIQDHCRRSGQAQPQSIGQFARCAYESLALGTWQSLGALAGLRDRPFTAIHLTGGGSQNQLLCQMLADCSGLAVIAGPAEGAALGNALMQAKALGEIHGWGQAGEVIRASVASKTYLPSTKKEDLEGWEGAKARLKSIQQRTPFHLSSQEEDHEQ